MLICELMKKKKFNLFSLPEYFLKLYKSLPLQGPVACFVKKKDLYVFSKVFYCRTYEFSFLPRFLLFILSSLLWYVKGNLSIFSNLLRKARSVKTKHGISVLKQAKDLIYFAFVYSIDPGKYYNYWFYNKQILAGKTFMANTHISPILGFLSRSGMHFIINDKYEFWCKIHNLVNKVPEILALVTRYDFVFTNSSGNLPSTDLFFKPANGSGGRNCYVINYLGNSQYQIGSSEIAYDEQNLKLLLKSIAKNERYILQYKIVNHPSINRLSNHGLSTCRIITFISSSNEVCFLFALFMMPVFESITSNTIGIGSAVDLDTGRLSPAISVNEPLEKIHIHPQGKGRITDSVLPFWKESKNICKKAHSLLMDLPFIGWDVALSPDGPVLLEGNICWDVEGWQFTHNDHTNQDQLIPLLEFHLKKQLTPRAKHI